MVNPIFAHYTASISDLKKSPMAVIEEANGEPLAILNHNEPVFYCVPRNLYEKLLETLDDYDLIKLVQERKGEKAFEVSIDDL